MANTLNIALLQMNACGVDWRANLEKGETFCRQARQAGADIALFPEQWSNGYYLPKLGDTEDLRAWKAQAVPQDGPYVRHFQALARELEMAIGLTYLEEWSEAPRNSLSLIDRGGQILMTYAKLHTCDFDTEIALTPGQDFYVSDLVTAGGTVKVGAMICYDREFPESARILMLKGAEVILVPNACELEINRLTQIRCRAYENMLAVATANYASPTSNGHSLAYDGIAYAENEGSRDMLLVEAGGMEGVYLAKLDLETLRTYRSREGWGDAYRKPGRYQALVEKAVRPPFVRPEARRE